MKEKEIVYFNKNKTVSKGMSILILAFLIFGFIAGNLYSEVGDIPTVKAMWAKAIELHGKGELAEPAMAQIWMNRASDATLTDVAGIIVGVYADTYWTLTKMDRAKLSMDLQGATSKGSTDCDNAANEATSQWHGILMRRNKNDTGQIPVTGDFTVSYDIVCSGTKPLGRETLIKKWADPLWVSPTINSTNNCYTRCAIIAFQGEIKEAKARMFYTDAGFNNPPTDWTILYDNNNIFSPIEGLTKDPLNVTTNPRGASGAFIFTPRKGKHYSFIAAVSTEFFGNNPLNVISGNWDSQEFIKNNGATAWHNFDIQKSQEATLKLNNMDSQPERFAFEAHCYKVPADTVVSLVCRDPNVILDTGSVKVTNESQIVSTEAVLPAHYKGDLIVIIKGPGSKLLPTGASVEVRMVWLLPYGHKHYMQAASMLGEHEAIKNQQVMRVSMGSYTFIGTDH